MQSEKVKPREEHFDLFWQTGEALATFSVNPARPEVENAILERLDLVTRLSPLVEPISIRCFYLHNFTIYHWKKDEPVCKSYMLCGMKNE